jgi:hypothetical protein
MTSTDSNIFGVIPWRRRLEPPATSSDHDHADPDPITDTMHDNSWSANLEQPHHAADVELVVEQAKETYLSEALRDEYGDAIEIEYVDHCGCGGHVTRVHV